MIQDPPKNVILAFTGASGAHYGLRILETLIASNIEVILLISKAGLMVLASETDLSVPSQPKKITEYFTNLYKAREGQITSYSREDWMAPIASGSGGRYKTMIVCPCTTGCVSAIATGASDNLLERAADVIIKENGTLVLVVREMPLSPIHLAHMLQLSQLGVKIMPACPGFYFKPKTMEDIVNFVAGRVLDQIGVKHTLLPHWGDA